MNVILALTFSLLQLSRSEVCFAPLLAPITPPFPLAVLSPCRKTASESAPSKSLGFVQVQSTDRICPKLCPKLCPKILEGTHNIYFGRTESRSFFVPRTFSSTTLPFQSERTRSSHNKISYLLPSESAQNEMGGVSPSALPTFSPSPIQDGKPLQTSKKFGSEREKYKYINDPMASKMKPPPYPLDENGRPVDVRGSDFLRIPVTLLTENETVAEEVNVQTPHSGRKFRPTHPNTFSYKATQRSSGLRSLRSLRRRQPSTSQNESYARKIRKWLKKPKRNNRRFTEGWYYRLTLPPPVNESFVFIFSIEDAGRWVRSTRGGMHSEDQLLGESSQATKLRSILQSLKRFKPNFVKSPLTLACMQLLGPQDTYLVQSDEDDTKFWGWKYSQGYGCTFEWNTIDDFRRGENSFCEEGLENFESVGCEDEMKMIAAMTPNEWRKKVKSGFQFLPFHLLGRLDGHDGTLGGVKANQGIPGTAEFDMTIRPVAGWGNYPPLSCFDERNSACLNKANDYRQFSTAGWLASYPVFEPHWQITMAHARATGNLTWNGTVYEFDDAPFYGEKNWGGAFPTKWYWAQCNSFDNYPDLSFTSGGGIRELPFSFFPGKRTETLGLIGIHYKGNFYEIVPWTGTMEWEVWPWGRWDCRGRCTDKSGTIQFEAEISAATDENVPGVLLRAPTKDKGMQYFCRDSGFGKVTLSLWLLEWDEDLGDYVRARDKQPLIDKATSSQCAVEIGGGPWRDVWRVSSKMSRPFKAMVRLPYKARGLLGKK